MGDRPNSDAPHWTQERQNAAMLQRTTQKGWATRRKRQQLVELDAAIRDARRVLSKLVTMRETLEP